MFLNIVALKKILEEQNPSLCKELVATYPLLKEELKLPLENLSDDQINFLFMEAFLYTKPKILKKGTDLGLSKEILEDFLKKYYSELEDIQKRFF